MMLILGSTVSAADVKVSYMESNSDYVIIEGAEAVAPDANITLSVFAEGKSYNDIIGEMKDEKDILVFLDAVRADGDGKWKAEWKPGKSGDYAFYVSCDNVLLNAVPDTFTVVAGMQKTYNVLKSGSATEIESALSDKMVLASLYGDSSLKDEALDIQKVAESISAIRKSEGNANIADYVKTAVLMSVLEEKPSTGALDALIEELYARNKELSNIDVYKESATEDIKLNLAERFGGCTKLGLDEFDKAFTENLILAGVYKSSNWSDAQTFLELLEDSDYSDAPSKVAKEVVGNDFTMSELIDAIEDAAKPSKSSGGSSGGGGGGSSGGASSITVNVPEPAEKQPEITSAPVGEIFEDVKASHWAYDYINQLRWDNIVSGDEKGNFNPDNNITRAEAVKILCSAFGIEPVQSGTLSFEDVTSDKWFFGYINAAFAKKLVSGTSDSEFSPNRQITRQELTVLIYRFMSMNGYTFKEIGEAEFPDGDLISEYAKAAVNALCGEGIINGMDDSSFAPKSAATRAQTAVMVSKAMMLGKQVTE